MIWGTRLSQWSNYAASIGILVFLIKKDDRWKKCPKEMNITRGSFYKQSTAFGLKHNMIYHKHLLYPIDSLSERKSISLCVFGTSHVCASLWTSTVIHKNVPKMHKPMFCLEHWCHFWPISMFLFRNASNFVSFCIIFKYLILKNRSL